VICFGLLIVVCQMQTAAPPAVVCPPVRTWTRQFQRQVAAEMRMAPHGALAQVAVQAIGDRDVARACARTGGFSSAGHRWPARPNLAAR
jgi:hypothetical protein